MKKLLNVFFPILPAIFSLSNLYGQVLEYDVLLIFPIGTFKVERSFGVDEEVITKTNSHVNVLFNNLKISSETISKKGVIIYSEYNHYINDKQIVKTTLYKSDGKPRTIASQNGQVRTTDQKPSKGVADLYFNEPSDIDSVYSERFGRLCPVSKVGKGIYKLVLPDKSICEYYYKDGYCFLVKTNLRGKTIKLVFKHGTQRSLPEELHKKNS